MDSMEETNNSLQAWTSSSDIVRIENAKSLAAIRLDPVHFPHYKDIPQPERLKWMTKESMTLAEIARIRDFDMMSAARLATVLDEMLMEDHYLSDLTLPEFHEAFKSGVFGLLGDFHGISAPNLYGFAEKWLESDKKRESAEIVRKTKAELRAEKTRQEQEEERRRIREEIEQAKRDGTFVPTGKAWYKPKSVDEVLREPSSGDWPAVWQKILNTAKMLGEELPEGPAYFRTEGRDMHLSIPTAARDLIEHHVKEFKPVLWPFVQAHGCMRLIYDNQKQ